MTARPPPRASLPASARSKAAPPSSSPTTPRSRPARGGPRRSPRSCARRKSPCATALPIVYLVDSAGVNLPYQDGIFPGPVWRRPHLLLQLADAAQAARSADCRRDGPLHRGRRLSARAQRRHHHGGRHQLHGAGRAQPGERRHRPVDRSGIARRRASAHRRSAASRTTWRRTMRTASR